MKCCMELRPNNKQLEILYLHKIQNINTERYPDMKLSLRKTKAGGRRDGQILLYRHPGGCPI